MRGVRFLILLVIGIGLGAYAYYDARKGPVDDTPKRDKVFSVESDKIDEIEVKSESGDRTTLRMKHWLPSRLTMRSRGSAPAPGR